MSVYNQISHNKIRTYIIIVLFVFLTAGFFFLIGKVFDNSVSAGGYFAAGFVFALLSSFGSYFYSDKIVLFTVSARPADKETFFDFYTVAENLSIAAGIPMPKLYVIDDLAPNAFATGRDPKHAVVGATTGLLQKLDRAELEGVIAHELSHIKNYDILLTTMVAVLVGTIALVSDWIMRSFWWGGLGSNDNKRDKNPIMFLFVIIGLILGPIIATLIQLAISRRREFLADASGVLITRYPEGLARALEKISADPQPMRSATSSTAHLFISNPFKKNQKGLSVIASLFSTHPPVEERLKVLRSM